jgi:DMSO/TMAO reductase YedYZ molybdopterin-dependent catalytic subunit
VAARRTNLALLVLLAVAVASGVAMFAVGSGWNRWPTLVHGTAAIGIVALSPWKSAISRRGIDRRGWGGAWPSLALVVLVLLTLVTGFAHRAGLRDLDPFPLLLQQLHVGAAVATLPFFAWHVAARPTRPRAADLSRRTALRGGAVLGASAVATVALPHASDRFTRSLERGSHDPGAMPVTQWLDDDVPRIDPDAWRLEVAGRPWSLGELEALVADRGVDRAATLDCTGGWYATQRWRGVPLDVLLAESGAAPAAGVDVRSVTGYARRFPARDLPHLLVATGYEGRPLRRGHGAPARLVAPGRRGFWWVKWIDTVEPTDDPWWWQPPFPLT